MNEGKPPADPPRAPLSPDERRLLELGHPDYEFPKEVHNLLMAANQTNMTLSEMADSKASILLGASFVVFSLSIGSLAEGKANFPMLVLTLFSFIATIFGVLTVRPNRMRKSRVPLHGKKVNILFFGSYIDCPREEYVEDMLDPLSDQSRFLDIVARDVYQNGQVLAHKKYRLLRLAYSIFIVGLVASVAAFAITGLK